MRGLGLTLHSSTRTLFHSPLHYTTRPYCHSCSKLLLEGFELYSAYASGVGPSAAVAAVQ